MVVVKDQDNWCAKRSHLVHEERYYLAGNVRDRGPKRPADLIAAQSRAGLPQCEHDIPPQPAGVIVTAVEGNPSERPVFRCTDPPLRRESGLAEARRRSEERRVGKECRSRWSRYH